MSKRGIADAILEISNREKYGEDAQPLGTERPAREAALLAALSHAGRMRGAVPTKKGEHKKQANTVTSAKGRRKGGTNQSRDKKSGLKSVGKIVNSPATKETDVGEQEADKTPKKRNGTLRGAARRVKQAIPDIVDKMVEEAKNGNVQHLKTVLQCTGVDRLLEQECRPRKKKSLAELLIRRLEKQNEQRNPTEPELNQNRLSSKKS